jgi:hypothetical protein
MMLSISVSQSPFSLRRGAEEFARHPRGISMDNIAIYSFSVDAKKGRVLASGIGAGIEKYLICPCRTQIHVGLPLR